MLLFVCLFFFVLTQCCLGDQKQKTKQNLKNGKNWALGRFVAMLVVACLGVCNGSQGGQWRSWKLAVPAGCPDKSQRESSQSTFSISDQFSWKNMGQCLRKMRLEIWPHLLVWPLTLREAASLSPCVRVYKIGDFRACEL